MKKDPKNPLAESFARNTKSSSRNYVEERQQFSVGAHSRAVCQDSIASDVLRSRPHPSDDQPPEPYEFWCERWAIDCYSTPCAQALPSYELSEQDLQCISAASVDVTALIYGHAPGVFVNAGWRCDDRIGLRNNQGSSCFINVISQVLQRVQGFRMCLEGHRSYCRRGVRDCAVCALHEDCKSQDLGYPIPHSPFTACVRGGALDVARSDHKFSGKIQCDAVHFLGRLCEIFYQKELDRSLHIAQGRDDAEMEQVVSSRGVLREFVWGVLIRSRISCAGCGVASDRLYYDDEDILKLELPPDGSACRLEELLCRFSQPDNDNSLQCPGPLNARCARDTTNVTRQYFIEKEPSVLILQLQRGQQRGRQRWKLQNNVAFPEILTCMRSGDYHFAAAVRHQGDHSRAGHYYVNLWLGEDGYAEVNCLPPESRRLSWVELKSSRNIKKDVYILVYVRLGFREHASDGSEATPYKRDDGSEKLLQHRFRGERRSDSSDHARQHGQVASVGGKRRLTAKTSEAESVHACNSSGVPKGSNGTQEFDTQCSQVDEMQHGGPSASHAHDTGLRMTASSACEGKTPSMKRDREGSVQQGAAIETSASSVGDSICHNTRRRTASRVSK